MIIFVRPIVMLPNSMTIEGHNVVKIVKLYELDQSPHLIRLVIVRHTTGE
jgi:hypothetical protein